MLPGRFEPSPTWPDPPEGFVPPPGWSPAPSWATPPGWWWNPISWKLLVPIGMLILVAVLLMGVFVGAVVISATAEQVYLFDDGQDPLRISGCTIDDAIDLDAGQLSSEVDVPSTEGCSVFAPDSDYAYLGCLQLTPNGPNDRTVPVRRTLLTPITRNQCDAIH